MTRTIRSYAELFELKTFLERYNYLRLNGRIGEDTFGFDRYLNQTFYRSVEWKRVRDIVIVRDNGCDLGIDGYEIHGRVLIHHLNPITMEMIERRDPRLFDTDNLITVSHNTHNAIHYGDESLLPVMPAPRRKGDTKLW